METSILVLSANPMESQGVRRMLGAEGMHVQIIADPKQPATATHALLIADADLLGTEALRALVAGGGLMADADLLVLGRAEDAGSYAGVAEAAGLSGAVEAISRPMHPFAVKDAALGMMARRAKGRRTALVAEYGVAQDAPGIEFHPDGTWARRLQDGTIELGVDLRQHYASGKMICIELGDQEYIEAGQAYGRLHLGERAVSPIVSPVGGRIVERNGEANAAVCMLTREAPGEGWLLRLMRVAPRK